MLRVFIVGVLLLSPALAVAEPPSSTPISVAGAALPSGQDSPEGAAVDFARAFVDHDAALFRRVCIRDHAEGDAAKALAELRQSVVEGLAAMSEGTSPHPDAPAKVEKIFAFRNLSRNGPASYGFAAFGFQNLGFVDVLAKTHAGDQITTRTMVIKDRDGKWYVHPAPEISPLLSTGLNDEPDSTEEFVTGSGRSAQ